MSFLILIELTFTERSRDSDTSKTYPGFSFGYLILLFMYLVMFNKEFYKKKVSKFTAGKKINNKFKDTNNLIVTQV